mgnify:CR=1 FL=1
MLLLIIVHTLLFLSILIISPLVWCGFGKIFKIENLTFKKALLTYLLFVSIVYVPQIIPLGLTLLKINNAFISPIISIATLVVIIWMLKTRLNTTVLKSVGLFVSNLIVAACLVFGLIRPFIAESYNMPSSSMEDTLLVGDRILVNKLAYAFQPPKKGDIIALVPPHERDKHYLKRIVALENDTVEVQGKTLFVNGQAVQEDYTKYVYDQPGFRGSSPRPPFPPFRSQPQDLPTFERWQEFSDFDEKTFERYFKDYTTSLKEYRPFVVPPGYVFAMGDNRDQSYDSRGWGPVALEDIKGRAHVIYWSQGVGAVGKNEVRLYRIGTSL